MEGRAAAMAYGWLLGVPMSNGGAEATMTLGGVALAATGAGAGAVIKASRSVLFCPPSSCISWFNRFLSSKVIRLAHWRLSLVSLLNSSSGSLLSTTWPNMAARLCCPALETLHLDAAFELNCVDGSWLH